MRKTHIAFGLVALPSDLAMRLDKVCKRLGLEPGRTVELAVLGTVADLERMAKAKGAAWCRRFSSLGKKRMKE